MTSQLQTQIPFAGLEDTARELLDRLADLTPLKTWVFAEVKTTTGSSERVSTIPSVSRPANS